MFGKFKKNELLAWKILQISISFLYKTEMNISAKGN